LPDRATSAAQRGLDNRLYHFINVTKGTQWVVYNLAFVFLAQATTELYFEFEKTDDRAANFHPLTRDFKSQIELLLPQ